MRDYISGAERDMDPGEGRPKIGGKGREQKMTRRAGG